MNNKKIEGTSLNFHHFEFHKEEIRNRKIFRFPIGKIQAPNSQRKSILYKHISRAIKVQ